MSTPLTIARSQERTHLSTLRTVMITGLVGNVVANVILQALIVQALIVPLTIIMVLTLLIAAVCATRWRWAPLLAVLWVLVSGRNTFDQAELRARVGETVALRLENSDTQTHFFDIDAFDVHVPMPSGKPALALFTPTAPGTYRFTAEFPATQRPGWSAPLSSSRRLPS